MKKNDLGDIRYFIDHEKRIIFAERHDDLSRSRVYAEWQALERLEGFDPTYDTLVDYSRVTDANITYDDVKKLGQDMPALDPRTGNVAIVSGLQHGRYLMARFYCLITNLVAIRKHQVFQDRVEAESWLLSLRENA